MGCYTLTTLNKINVKGKEYEIGGSGLSIKENILFNCEKIKDADEDFNGEKVDVTRMYIDELENNRYYNIHDLKSALEDYYHDLWDSFTYEFVIDANVANFKLFFFCDNQDSTGMRINIRTSNQPIFHVTVNPSRHDVDYFCKWADLGQEEFISLIPTVEDVSYGMLIEVDEAGIVKVYSYANGEM